MDYEEAVYKVASVFDLEELLKGYLGITHDYYNVVAINGWNNDTLVSIEVKKNNATEYDKKAVLEAKEEVKNDPDEAEPSVIAWSILNVMCDEGLLDEGDYLIDVSW